MNPRTRIAAAVALLALALVPALSFAADTGTANFTTYVALGDSLTAGFASASINRTYQRNSYPALIFHQATGQPTSAFEQPLVTEPGLPGILELRSLVPLVIAPVPGQGVPANLNLPRPYNNMAIPGARVHDLLTKTASTSASDPTDLVLRQQGATQLQQGLALRPTFVTLWIGNNDVLAAATSGRAIPGVTLTPPALFDADYRAIAGAIAASGAKMAVANIPDVTSIPFVTTVSRFVPNPATGQPVLINGQPVPLIGPEGPLVSGDFVLLTATSELSQGRGIPAALGGSGQPLSDGAVLSAAEVATIRDHRNNYNATITAVANQHGAAFVDAAGTLAALASRGINIGGVTFTSALLTGGVFSYDGVHPNQFGYAYVANLFIDAINEKFDGAIPLVDLFPFMFQGAGTTPTPAATTIDGVPVAWTGLYFSPQAWETLRKSLGVPSDAEITQAAKPRKPRRGNRH